MINTYVIATKKWYNFNPINGIDSYTGLTMEKGFLRNTRITNINDHNSNSGILYANLSYSLAAPPYHFESGFYSDAGLTNLICKALIEGTPPQTFMDPQTFVQYFYIDGVPITGNYTGVYKTYGTWVDGNNLLPSISITSTEDDTNTDNGLLYYYGTLTGVPGPTTLFELTIYKDAGYTQLIATGSTDQIFTYLGTEENPDKWQSQVFNLEGLNFAGSTDMICFNNDSISGYLTSSLINTPINPTITGACSIYGSNLGFTNGYVRGHFNK